MNQSMHAVKQISINPSFVSCIETCALAYIKYLKKLKTNVSVFSETPCMYKDTFFARQYPSYNQRRICKKKVLVTSEEDNLMEATYELPPLRRCHTLTILLIHTRVTVFRDAQFGESECNFHYLVCLKTQKRHSLKEQLESFNRKAPTLKRSPQTANRQPRKPPTAQTANRANRQPRKPPTAQTANRANRQPRKPPTAQTANRASRETPTAKRQTRNAKRETPNAKRQPRNANRETPTAKRQPRNANRETPTAKRQPRNANRETPTAKRQPRNANRERRYNHTSTAHAQDRSRDLS